MADDLAALRAAIDALDDELLRLLDRRAGVVQQVGALKRSAKATAFHAPGRERDILERLGRAAGGPFPRDAVRPVFREILSACLALEEPLRVAYPGPEASFSHMAGRSRFGLSARYVPASSLGEVFRMVRSGGADYGVLPEEEASEGLVTRALDMCLDGGLPLVGEIVVEVAHALLTRSGTTAGVDRVYAHPQAAARCAAGLVEAIPGARILPAVSAAAAAESARDDARAAALAPALAAEIFDLAVARPRLDDGAIDVARFLLVGPEPAEPSGHDVTCLVVGLDDKPGRLAAVLEHLGAAGLNVRRVVSRPAAAIGRGQGDDRVGKGRLAGSGLRDLFFIDLDGHAAEAGVRDAVAGLGAKVPFVQVLGSYARHQAGA